MNAENHVLKLYQMSLTILINFYKIARKQI